MGRNATGDGRLFPHFGREDFLRDLPAAIDLQQRQLIGEEARWNGAFELHVGHCRIDEVDCQHMIVAGEALLLWRRSCPNLVQPAVTGRDHQFAGVRNAGQRACWMKYAGDLASIALVKSVEVGLDHAFDDLTSSVPVMEVRSFDVDLSEIMGPKCAKLLPRAYERWKQMTSSAWILRGPWRFKRENLLQDIWPIAPRKFRERD